MKIKFITEVIIISSILFSCSNPIADIMLRTYDDPIDIAPNVDSFKEEYKIYLNWEKDEGCDEYILLRSDDSATPQFSEIYRGTDLGFVDTNLNHNSRYLYRLNKRRGQRTFISKKYGRGFCSPKRRDVYDNHTKENALLLIHTIDNLNLYRGMYSDGTEVFEEDWFYVRVPARNKTNIKVVEVSQGSSVLTAPPISYLIEGNSYTNVGQGFDVANENMEEAYIAFKLKLTSAPSAGTLDIITYKIKIENTSPITQ